MRTPVGKVVCQVNGYEDTGGGGVDGHVVSGVVQELGPGVPLHVMGVIVTPSQLHVNPVLLRGGGVHHVLGVSKEGWSGDIPLVCSEKEDVSTTGVHLVTLPGVNCLLLDCLNLQGVQLLVEDLAQVHHHRLVDLLPQMSPEDLNEGNLQGGDLPVHEDTSQVKLDLEPNIHVGSVDGGGPPQGEAPVGDLIQARPLGIGQLLVFHTLLKTGGLLPEEPLPGGEVGPLEQGVLQDPLHPTQGLDHVSPVVVQVPEFTIVSLMGPPEWVLFQHLVSLKLCPHSPSLVICKGVSVLLEQGVDPGDAPVPAVLQVLQCEPPVLCGCFLPLESILSPHSLAVNELSLPGLDVPVQVGDELVLLVAHAGPEVGDAGVRLLGPPQV